MVALPPALVQLLLLFPARGAHPGRGARVASALVIASLATGSLAVGIWLYRIAGPPTFGPRVPLKPISRATLSPAMPRVIRYLRRQVAPGEAIFVARQEPLLYFATGTRNPTPFEGVLQGVRELQEPPILTALEQVRYVVMSDLDQPHFTYYSDELPGVWRYLERHFRIPEDFRLDDASWIAVLERTGDRGPTVLDLHALRPDAQLWQRSESGERRAAGRPLPRLAARHLNRPFPIELGARGGGADFDVTLPERARFRSAVGFRGLVALDNQYVHPRHTTAVVSIRPRDEPDFRQVAAHAIDDHPRGGRRWVPLEADLSAWAGERVTLRIELRARRSLRPGEIGWFGSPRITVPPEAAAGVGEVAPSATLALPRERATLEAWPASRTSRRAPRGPDPDSASSWLAASACCSGPC